jgi:hypothetical protein
VVQWIELGLVVLGLLVLITRVLTAENQRPYCLLALVWSPLLDCTVQLSLCMVLFLISSIQRRSWQSGY